VLAILGFGFAAGALLHAIGSAIAAGVRSIAAWVMTTFLHALTATTTPQLTGGWFSGAWKGEMAVALAFAAPCIIAGAVQSLIHGEPGEMTQRLIAGTAIVVVVLGAGRVLIQGLISAVDGACTMLLNIGAGGPAHVVAVWSSVAGATAGAGMLATLSVGPAVLVGLVIILAGIAIWIELATRMAVIYLLVAFAPLSVVAIYWHWGARWARRLGEVLLAVILAQLVITTVFVIGTDALAGIGSNISKGAPGGAIGALATAIGMMLLGTIALPAALRLAPHVSDAAAAPLGQAAGHITSAAKKAAAAGATGEASAAAAGGTGSGGGASAAAGGGGDGGWDAGSRLGPIGRVASSSVAAMSALGHSLAGEAGKAAASSRAGRVATDVVKAGYFGNENRHKRPTSG
jgi:hypothetical protein